MTLPNSSHVTPKLRTWFVLNVKIGALSFGGSGRLLLYQEAVVDELRWMSEERFREVLTLAQVFPGPNLVNLAVYLGYIFFGWKGAISALLALVTPGSALIVFFFKLLPFENERIEWLFHGFSLGSIALFSIFLFRYSKGLLEPRNFTRNSSPPNTKLRKKFSPLLLLRFALAAGVCAASILGTPLFWTMGIGAVLGLAVEWAHAGREHQHAN